MQYMLDTNICIALVKRRPPQIQRKLSKIPVGQVGISSVVLAELWYGVFLSKRQEQNKRALKAFLDFVLVLDWPEEAAMVYGKIRADLKRQGKIIGAKDLLIAAHALAGDSVLVTDNLKEFNKIEGLRLENWLTAK